MAYEAKCQTWASPTSKVGLGSTANAKKVDPFFAGARDHFIELVPVRQVEPVFGDIILWGKAHAVESFLRQDHDFTAVVGDDNLGTSVQRR
jgi:hypothetical protein